MLIQLLISFIYIFLLTDVVGLFCEVSLLGQSSTTSMLKEPLAWNQEFEMYVRVRVCACACACTGARVRVHVHVRAVCVSMCFHTRACVFRISVLLRSSLCFHEFACA